MTHKRIGYYTDIQSHAPISISAADQLIIEISCEQVVIMVRSQLPKQVEGFEIFAKKITDKDWTSSLNEIKAASKLLSRQYNHVLVCYNLSEALAIPTAQFTVAAAKDFLDQIYGDTSGQVVLHETLFSAQIEIAYRIPKELNDWMQQMFPSHKTMHVYTELLNQFFAKTLSAGHHFLIRVYSGHLIVALVKDQQLQIIQSFNYETEEDIFYYLMSLKQQFHIDTAHAAATISGELDKQSGIAKKLNGLVGNLSWETADNNGVFASVVAKYPAHYFSGYYKLGA